MNFRIASSLFLTLIATLVSACASTNPYNVAEDEGAVLRNRIIYEGEARYSLFFTYAGKKHLQPDITTPSGRAYYKIPAGRMSLRLLVNYAPKVRHGFGIERQYEIYVPEVSLDAVDGEVYVVNCTVGGGRASVWLETESGRKVSETLDGLRLDYPYFEVWTTLPDPVR